MFNLLAFDLEVDPRTRRIFKLGAVLGDEVLQGKPEALMAQLAQMMQRADGWLGHNIVAHDLPILRAAYPALLAWDKPVIDTLRLNPLAFPRNPYHRLVKLYQDGQLFSGQRNDPLADARLARVLFDDQCTALRETDARYLLVWHGLLGGEPGMDSLFAELRGALRPTLAQMQQVMADILHGRACDSAVAALFQNVGDDGWALAYALAWISVAGENSVMPPWVRTAFPQAAAWVVRLRDTACHHATCGWCSEKHNALAQLKQHFNLESFRPRPLDERTQKSLQQVIVESGMARQSVLGILPTGTGKSLCYQIPALARFERTGALTVVISPLVALMADQVNGLLARGINCAAALNGLLSMPERQEVLDKIRLGDVGILLVSPEQLRSSTFRRALAQREVGGWVLDEAHCLSKWGHDFRPDYRYVGRFIRERAGDKAIPPILCLTATAKLEVVNDIQQHFRDKLAIALLVLDGGAERRNLTLEVRTTDSACKYEHVYQLIAAHLDLDKPDAHDGAIVYCATQRQTEELAEFLRNKSLAAGYFHAGMTPSEKKQTQQTFIHGELRVITATNAFGMGIDKPDVRLVVHADIPGSLENYLQEAGRAGRDQQPAHCVLLYTPEDVERQFSMSARSRLSRREIQAILDALRNLERKKRGEVLVATPGEILAEDENGGFERDQLNDDTRVRTAIAWLEEAQLLAREENRVQVFPSSLHVQSLQEAECKLSKSTLTQREQQQLLSMVETLMVSRPDEGISTDELMGVTGLNIDGVRKALYDLERLGIARNDTALTAYVHAGVERGSWQRYQESCALEQAMITQLRLNAPDLSLGEGAPLHVRTLCQYLKDHDFPQLYPEVIRRMLKSLAMDGRDNAEQGNRGSIVIKKLDADSLLLILQRSWGKLEETATLRREAAGVLLRHLLQQVAGHSGLDLLAETTLGKLQAALDDDLVLAATIKNSQKCLDYALLWLHEQEIIRLNKGMAVFRPAMTIKLESDWRKKFSTADFAPLEQHYHEQIIQIHVMAEYVQRGLEVMGEALALIQDYFKLTREVFLQRWLPHREAELQRQTTAESWQRIVEALNNKTQRDIVCDNRENTNVLVLAGPGSGKTRVLVHRMAYLIRVRRENPRSIIALAYNRHAAVQIRQRLRDLIADDAIGVTILTLHGLAMRLLGCSLADKNSDEFDFNQLLLDAVALLRGDNLLPDEADSLRSHLLGGFRWIFVDEYQDIDQAQYQLISALAGRTRSDEQGRINLFAVGDDDQNIYDFKGASSIYIRRFEQDYAAKPCYLLENYRSTAHIIAACNQVIAPAANRMKIEHPIRINTSRSKDDPGGVWQKRDALGQGRVQLLSVPAEPLAQTLLVMLELQRLSSLDAQWNWSNCALIARNWKNLQVAYQYCQAQHIPVYWGAQSRLPFWKFRETQALVDWLNTQTIVNAAGLQAWVEIQSCPLLSLAIAEYQQEIAEADLPVAHCKDWLAEWGREIRNQQPGLLLTTAHGAKGLEFDHVAILDLDWQVERDADALRRLYYVAMTRAKATLILAQTSRPFHRFPHTVPYLFPRQLSALPDIPDCLHHYYAPLELADLDLGYAGRRHVKDPIHYHIQTLQNGSPLQLKRRNNQYYLLDEQDHVVGKMSKNYTPPAQRSCLSVHVHRILRWHADERDSAKYGKPACEQWEVVVPEMVWGGMEANTTAEN